MKRVLIVAVLLIISISALFYKYIGINFNSSSLLLKDDFNSINEEFWYVGEWGTNFPANKQVDVKNGIINLEVKEIDRGPYLISKPIEIKDGDVITIKRRVKLHYANEHFTGGMSLFQTNDTTLKLSEKESEWFRNFGDALVMVEYVHNSSEDSSRPGKHTFRVLPPNWDKSNNAIFEPIFDDWFEEELIYDTKTNLITYRLNDEVKQVKGLKMDKNNIRILMHNYGWDTGHIMRIDWVEVDVSNKKSK